MNRLANRIRSALTAPRSGPVINVLGELPTLLAVSVGALLTAGRYFLPLDQPLTAAVLGLGILLVAWISSGGVWADRFVVLLPAVAGISSAFVLFASNLLGQFLPFVQAISIATCGASIVYAVMLGLAMARRVDPSLRGYLVFLVTSLFGLTLTVAHFVHTFLPAAEGLPFAMLERVYDWRWKASILTALTLSVIAVVSSLLRARSARSAGGLIWSVFQSLAKTLREIVQLFFSRFLASILWIGLVALLLALGFLTGYFATRVARWAVALREAPSGMMNILSPGQWLLAVSAITGVVICTSALAALTNFRFLKAMQDNNYPIGISFETSELQRSFSVSIFYAFVIGVGFWFGWLGEISRRVISGEITGVSGLGGAVFFSFTALGLIAVFLALRSSAGREEAEPGKEHLPSTSAARVILVLGILLALVGGRVQAYGVRAPSSGSPQALASSLVIGDCLTVPNSEGNGPLFGDRAFVVDCGNDLAAWKVMMMASSKKTCDSGLPFPEAGNARVCLTPLNQVGTCSWLNKDNLLLSPQQVICDARRIPIGQQYQLVFYSHELDSGACEGPDRLPTPSRLCAIRVGASASSS